MLRIGEFSVLSQISIYMLRHYNEIGLLIPEHIDEFTGYRYYSENQLPIANKIQALKNMGLSLSLIKEILTKYTNNDELKKYLELHASEQREKIANMQQQLNLIETTIENLERTASIPLYSVALKKFPTHNVISVRGIIATPNQEAVLWEPPYPLYTASSAPKPWSRFRRRYYPTLSERRNIHLTFRLT
ncbi:MAG: helix-turn-helix domain-containing protein [Lachnospiraceae bacterium]|nr:helix-turn-helix domain-containing protein [Lachnospiraceae bacterium]